MLIHLLVHLLIGQLLCHDFLSARYKSKTQSDLNGSNRSFYTYGEKLDPRFTLDPGPVSDREVGDTPYPPVLPRSRDVGFFRLIGA